MFLTSPEGVVLSGFSRTNMKKVIKFTLSLASCVLWAASIQAATVYWDIDGANPGAGGATPAGVWDSGITANWTADAAGASAGTTFTDNDDAVFSAAADATGSYGVGLSGTPIVGNLTVEEGNITISGGTALNLGGGVALKGNLDVFANSTLTISSAITGGDNTGSITKGISGGTGTGTLVLSGANTYTGQTTVRVGTLSFDSIGNVNGGASALGNPSDIALGTIKLGGGTVGATLKYTGSGHSTDRVLNLATTTGTTLIDASGSGALVFTSATGVTMGANGIKKLQLGGSSTAENKITGLIVDSTARTTLEKIGAGTWVLTGLSTFSGVCDIRDGTLVINSIANKGTASAIGTGNFNNANAIIGLGTGGSTGTLKYVGSGHSSSRPFTLWGATGGGTIDASGTGALVLSGNIVNSTFATADKLFTLTGDSTAANTLSGVISDSVTAPHKTMVAKTGTGKWILGGANLYTGATTVSDGTLLVNGSIAAGSTVNVTGGTLGGTGTIGGDTTIQNGATLAPGTSAGTLNLNANLTLNDTSILDYELLGTDQTVGGGINDLAIVGGTLTLDGVLNISEIVAGSFLSANAGDTWRLFDYTVGLTDNGLALNSLPTLADGLGFAIDTGTFGQVNLIISVVPEPSTFALGLLGGFGLLAVVRRRPA